MPNYPKVTGETVFAKDSLDGKIKLLDTIIQLLRTADGDLDTAIDTLSQTLATVQSTANSASSAASAAQSKADSAYSLASTANSNANSSYVMKTNQSNLPASNAAYSLGSKTQRFKEIFTDFVGIGVQGEDWEINTNDGYITLEAGIILEWGAEEPMSDSTAALWDSVRFPKPFPSACYSAVMCRAINATSGNNEYIGYFQYPPTLTGFSFRRREKDDYFWIAIGE